MKPGCEITWLKKWAAIENSKWPYFPDRINEKIFEVIHVEKIFEVIKDEVILDSEKVINKSRTKNKTLEIESKR